MSREAVQGFLDRVGMDQNFAMQATECKRMKDLVQFARNAGYEFNDDEFIELTRLPVENWVEILAEVVSQLNCYCSD